MMQNLTNFTSFPSNGKSASMPNEITGNTQGHDEQLSNVPEESENGEEQDGDVHALETIETETSGNTDCNIGDAVVEIESIIPASELGEDETHRRSADASIPSVVFMIPFPVPVNGHRSKRTAPFLLYTPPRSLYIKPAKDENGKRPKEKLTKKMVRLYQEEVRFGEQLKRKEITKDGGFKWFHKARACCIRGASTLSKWLPAPCVETLARLPPKRKLGQVTIFFPTYAGEPRPDGEDQPYQPTEEDLRHDISVLLRRTRKRILIRMIVSGCFMPIAIGADVFAPVFLTEITVAYLAYQIYGFRKIKALTEASKPKKAKRKRSKKLMGKVKISPANDASLEMQNLVTDPVEHDSRPATELFRITPGDQAIFEPLLPLMYKICSRIDPLAFPPVVEATPLECPVGHLCQTTINQQPEPTFTQLPPTLHKPGPEVVHPLVLAFRASLPEEFQERHNLDEERLSEDLARYMKKAAVEYVSSLEGRPERSALKVTQKWFAKRKTVSKERKEKKQIKNQMKKEGFENLQASRPLDQSVIASTEPQRPEELPAVTTAINSKQEKKARLAEEKQKAKETIKRKAKREASEKKKLNKLMQEVRKGKKKAE